MTFPKQAGLGFLVIVVLVAGTMSVAPSAATDKPHVKTVSATSTRAGSRTSSPVDGLGFEPGLSLEVARRQQTFADALARNAAASRALAVERDRQKAAVVTARQPAPAPVSAVAPRSGATGVNWDGIAACETGGNWSMHGSRFSGGLGFANTTWSGFGGGQFAANAGDASREQQIVVAERVYARYGLSGWGCRAHG